MTDSEPDQPSPDATDTSATPGRRRPSHIRVIKYALVTIMTIHVMGVLYFAKAVVMPVIVAIVLSLILSPIVRFLRRRRIPEAASAMLIVLLLTGGAGGAVYGLSEPASNWLDNAPQIAAEIRYKVWRFGSPMEKVKDAAEEVRQATDGDGGATERVVVKEPGLVARFASGAPEVVGAILVTIVLLLFLLAAGDSFYGQLVRALPTIAGRKTGLRIAERVERDISRYLFTIAAINTCLGIVVGAGMYLVGMPNPALWGVAAALLNFAPYVGPLVGIAIVSAVAFVSFDTPAQMLLAPGIYLGANILEGQLITPMLLGRRLQMTALAVFLAILFWGWMWGPIGVLLAVPLLIVVRVFSDHLETLVGVRHFLAPQPNVIRARGLGARTAASNAALAQNGDADDERGSSS